jgi:glucose-6-phosphate isomerase
MGMESAPLVSIDSTRLYAEAIGNGGLDSALLAGMTSRLNDIHCALHARVASGELPFLALHTDTEMFAEVGRTADALRPDYDDCVVIGMGGSSLGGRALVHALGGGGLRVHFVDNVDPVHLHRLLHELDLERTLFNCVTKSGGTVETVAQFMIIRNQLLTRFGEAGYRQRVVVTTDPQRGAMRRLAVAEGLTTFEVPPGVGGRYSVLTPVGLFPAALAGVDIEALRAGAEWAAGTLASSDPRQNMALATAACLVEYDQSHGRSILFTVPYSDALEPSAQWFEQLWAESLGKENGGPTPVTAVGATSQHSVLQLWMEGPPNAVLAFIDVAQSDVDIAIPDDGPAVLPELGWLRGHSLGHILRTEKRATEQALADAGRPSLTWTLNRVSPACVAAWMVLTEAMTAYAGGLYGIDPFNQPGVEAGKVITKALLGNA